MRLTVVGCSPAWPDPGGAQSGYLVESAEGAVLLDCGPGVLARLRTSAEWPTPDAVIITHFHLDHWGDLVPWVWGAQSLGIDHRPALWLPPDGIARLREFGGLLGFADMFERAFVVREYAAAAEFQAGGHRVRATALPHYGITSFALRVSADARTLVYSGDCAPDPALADAAEEADLFVCEATLASGELDSRPRGHLSLDEACAAFEQSGARGLLITHRPAELGTPETVSRATDGLILTL